MAKEPDIAARLPAAERGRRTGIGAGRDPGWPTLLGALLLPLIVLGPNLPRLGEAAIGARWSDAWKHVWSQWWAWQELMQGRLPLKNQLLYFPEGGAFFSIDLANALLGAPLRPFLDPLPIYNLLLLLHLSLAFLAAAALARELGTGRGPALVTGALYAANAWVLSFPLGSGVSETAFLWPLPLVLLLAWRTLVRPGLGAPIAGALLLLLQALACWSYGLLAALAISGMLLYWLAGRPWALPPGDPARADRRTLGRMLLVVGIGLAGALPLYLAVSGTLSDGIYERSMGIFGLGGPSPLDLPETQAFGLAHLLVPGERALRVHIGLDILYLSGYLGWVGLGLGLLGVVRGQRLARVAMVFVLFFAILSLGPRIWLDLDRSGPGWPNPLYLVLWWFFPVFNASMHSADRFIVGAELALGLAAAAGLRSLRTGWPAGFAAAALVLAEALLISPAPWPVPQVPAPAPALAERLATGRGGVLDLPFSAAGPGRFYGEIFLQQTIHVRPVPYRFGGRDLQSVSPPLRDNAFFRALFEIMEGRQQSAPCADAERLASMGFGTVVLHEDWLLEERARLVARVLDRCLGPGNDEEGARIYEFPPGGSEGG